MDSVDVALSWPSVSTNHLYQHSGPVRLSDRAAAWRDETIINVRQSGGRLPAGPLLFILHAYAPPTKRFDLDNLVKLIQDSVFAAFGEDDSRVRELRVYRHDGPLGLIVSVLPGDPVEVPAR